MNFNKSIKVAALAAGLLITAAPAQAKKAPSDGGHWYFWVISPNASAGQKPAYAGPYPSLGECRDTLGSAIYSHPFACHMGGNPAVNCVDTGNGFAYPENYPYPPNQDQELTSPDCTQIPDDGPIALKKGLYFIVDTVDGAQVLPKKDYKKVRSQADTTPGMEITYYRDKACPQAPFFKIGADNACN